MHYRISCDEGTVYKCVDRQVHDHRAGRFELCDNRLTVEPRQRFPDVASVRSAVEPFLRAWEVFADLDGNPGTIRFAFVAAEPIDTESSTISLRASVVMSATAHARLTIPRTKYPEPPEQFEATPDVVTAFERWHGYRSGREPIQAMAYFVLTLLEWIAGHEAGDNKKTLRKKAAERFGISREVLDRIGQLTSERGARATARKAPRDGGFRELTDAETVWLDAAIRSVIRRMGHPGLATSSPPLQLKDLPEL